MFSGLKAVIYLENPTQPSKASGDEKNSMESCTDANANEEKKDAAKKMLNLGKIRCDPYKYEISEITLDFSPAQQEAAKTLHNSSVMKEDQAQAGRTADS